MRNTTINSVRRAVIIYNNNYSMVGKNIGDKSKRKGAYSAYALLAYQQTCSTHDRELSQPGHTKGGGEAYLKTILAPNWPRMRKEFLCLPTDRL